MLMGVGTDKSVWILAPMYVMDISSLAVEWMLPVCVIATDTIIMTVGCWELLLSGKHSRRSLQLRC